MTDETEGRPKGRLAASNLKICRRVPGQAQRALTGDWIPRTQRLPTQADADEQGRVLYWHRYQQTMVLGWHQMAHNEFLTHWQKTPPAPEGMEQEQHDGSKTELTLPTGGGN